EWQAPHAWLRRIAHNEALRVIERRRQHSELTPEAEAAAGPGPEERVLERLFVSTALEALSADERELVFEQFHRGRNVRERNVPGSGLGLAISRRLVEAHRGTIAFDPDRTSGSAVEVRLPLVADQAETIRIGAERTPA
ncbi:MAG: hypothetical protein GEU88_20960, partial [Solirubrobacterales bacterium]|nr:hypothetical protein [Solirubrobacterales bacterium]